MNRYAMIENGVVINICLWDGNTTTWNPPENIEMQLAPDYVSIGWYWKNNTWTPNNG